jgi:hypothetical protein
MAVLELKYDATPRELRLFTLLWLPAAFAVFGLVTWYWSGSLRVPVVLWSAGAVLGVLGTLAPTFGRVVFILWMTLTYPIGWVMSHLILGVIYFLVLTPIGLLLRVSGRDALKLGFDRSATTYWTERPSSDDDLESYFRGY